MNGKTGNKCCGFEIHRCHLGVWVQIQGKWVAGIGSLNFIIYIQDLSDSFKFWHSFSDPDLQTLHQLSTTDFALLPLHALSKCAHPCRYHNSIQALMDPKAQPPPTQLPMVGQCESNLARVLITVTSTPVSPPTSTRQSTA